MLQFVELHSDTFYRVKSGSISVGATEFEKQEKLERNINSDATLFFLL